MTKRGTVFDQVERYVKTRLIPNVLRWCPQIDKLAVSLIPWASRGDGAHPRIDLIAVATPKDLKRLTLYGKSREQEGTLTYRAHVPYPPAPARLSHLGPDEWIEYACLQLEMMLATSLHQDVRVAGSCDRVGCAGVAQYAPVLLLREREDAAPVEGRIHVRVCSRHKEIYEKDPRKINDLMPDDSTWNAIVQLFVHERARVPDRGLLTLRFEESS
jgi:hypothetical protein